MGVSGVFFGSGAFAAGFTAAPSALADVSISANAAPTATVSPSAAKICLTTPETVAGTSTVLGLLQDWAPAGLISAVAGASLFGHFNAITRGVIDLRDLVYFLSIIVAFLAANAVLIDLKKAD